MVHPSAPLIGVCPKTVRCAQRGSTPFKQTQLIEVHCATGTGCGWLIRSVFMTYEWFKAKQGEVA